MQAEAAHVTVVVTITREQVSQQLRLKFKLMSFAFDWQAFAHNDLFYDKCKRLLNVALNKNLPRIIEGPITVSELSWGDEAPTLETLEIGEVANDKFRGIFKLNYAGNGRLTLATKVQGNLLNVYGQTAPSFTTPKFVGASESLSIPLNLTLSDFRMSGIIICVYSKQKGLTCVFRNDPLQSIKVSSTFDGIPGIATFLQSQIENLIGGLFREELPAILYSHSQIWTRVEQVQAKTFDEMRQQLRLQHPDSPGAPSETPITFAEIDDQQVSFVNTMRIESLAVARRTLGLSTPQVPTAILRSELSRRHTTASASVPVTIDGEQIHEHVHAQAQRLAVKHNHKPRRRVLNVRRKKDREPEPVAEPEPEAVAAVEVEPEVEQLLKVPVFEEAVDVSASPAHAPEPASPAPARAPASPAPAHAPAPAPAHAPASAPLPASAALPASPPAFAPPPASTPALVSSTKAEIERIRNVMVTRATSSNFFSSNSKLDSPPAYREDELIYK